MTKCIHPKNQFHFQDFTEKRISFGVNALDKITNGGLIEGEPSLSFICSRTGVGKTLFLVHLACSAMMQNKNVLFITSECSKKVIFKRVQSNLLPTIANNKNYYTPIIQQNLGKLWVSDQTFCESRELIVESLLVENWSDDSPEPDIILIDDINQFVDSKNKIGFSPYHKLSSELNIPVVTSRSTIRKNLDNPYNSIATSKYYDTVGQYQNIAGGEVNQTNDTDNEYSTVFNNVEYSLSVWNELGLSVIDYSVASLILSLEIPEKNVHGLSSCIEVKPIKNRFGRFSRKDTIILNRNSRQMRLDDVQS